MTCEHLRALERALLDTGILETRRGQVWSDSCRERVSFDCILDLRSLRERFGREEIVKDHDHRSTYGGCEPGFHCSRWHDGIMGTHSGQGAKQEFRSPPAREGGDD
jgi:hypothetical protein